MLTDVQKLADRVLIVEDEENARLGYEALLRKWGLDVLGVPSAEDATDANAVAHVWWRLRPGT